MTAAPPPNAAVVAQLRYALQSLYAVCRDMDAEIQAERPTEEQYLEAMKEAEAALAASGVAP